MHVAADKRQCEIKTYVLNKRINRITAKQNLAAGARIRGACPESDNGANVLGVFFSGGVNVPRGRGMSGHTIQRCVAELVFTLLVRNRFRSIFSAAETYFALTVR